MPKVSVIVPVYGVESCLDKCVESILHQTYSDWELLLVDDGSPDKCGVMCDEWAKRDKRIKVFHKKNEGVSSARNLGLEKAEGTWVTFVDADDSIGPETLEKCALFFESADVIRFSTRFVYSEDGKKFRDFVLPALSQEDYISRIIARETILGVWGGVYLRKVFVEHNIKFDKSLVNGEDWVVLLQLILLAKKIAILPDTLYLYNKTNENSCTYTFNFKKSFSVIRALDKINELLKEEGGACFEKSVSRAKCELGYNFYASVISKSYKVSKEELEKYSALIGITKNDIRIGAHTIKERVFLMCFCNRLGQMVLKLFI